MSTFQDYVLGRLAEIAESLDGSVYAVTDFANTGRLVAKFDDHTIGTANYHFQKGHNQVVFNVPANATQRGLGTENGFLFSEEDDDKIIAMFIRWQELLAGKRAIKRRL